MAKEVKVPLTETQKARIQTNTGRDGESRVGRDASVPEQKTTMAQAADLKSEAGLRAAADMSIEAESALSNESDMSIEAESALSNESDMSLEAESALSNEGDDI
jgi:hypothetical protein